MNIVYDRRLKYRSNHNGTKNFQELDKTSKTTYENTCSFKYVFAAVLLYPPSCIHVNIYTYFHVTCTLFQQLFLAHIPKFSNTTSWFLYQINISFVVLIERHLLHVRSNLFIQRYTGICRIRIIFIQSALICVVINFLKI